MADVEITFGASIEELTKAVEKAKESIESFKESISHAFEIIGIALTIEGIKQFVESMADLGLQTDRTSQMLGLSSEEVGELSGVAKLTGTSMEGLTLGFERMNLNIQRSTRDGFNPAAQALRNFGLTAKELTGVSTPEYFGRLAEAVAKFNPGMALTTNVMALGGRGIALLIPFLRLGREGFQEFTEEVRKTGAILTETQKTSFLKTHESLTLLGLSFQGLGIRIFDTLAPAIKKAADSLREFIEKIDARKINESARDIAIAVSKTIGWLGDFAIHVEEIFIRTFGSFQNWAAKLKGAGIGAVSGGALGFASPIPGGTAVGTLVGGVVGWVASGKADEDLKKQIAELEKRRGDFAKWTKDFEATLTELVRPTTTRSLKGVGGDLIDIKGIDAAAKDAFDAYVKGLEGQISASKEYYALLKTEYEEDAATHKISESQKFTDTIDALNEEFEAVQGYYNKLLGDNRLTAAQRVEIEQKMWRDLERITQEGVKLEGDSTKKIQEQWFSMADSILGSWNSNLRGLLAGTESFKEAMIKTFGDLVIKVIEKIEDMIAYFLILLGLEIATGTVGSESITSLLKTAALKAFKFDRGAWDTGRPSLPFPSYDSGSFSTRGGLALFHPGEMVIPAGPAQQIREGGGIGGGTSVNIAISAMDAASFGTALRSGLGDAITRYVTKAIQMNPSMRPGYTT